MGIRKMLGSVRGSWGKVALGVSWVIVAGLAFYWGRCASLSQATAAPVVEAPAPAPQPAPTVPTSQGTSDYAREPVAYIYGVIPITRADLGEYLISRFGADRLDLLINRRVIEHACQEKGIEVTAAEIDASLNDDLKGLSVNKLDFVKNVLKHYNKTLYEWKEDVIRPRLLLAKLCRQRITITDDDLRQGFEAYYGEKVVCKIIIWPKDKDGNAYKRAMTLYPKIRDNAIEFDREAKQQAIPRLAASGGEIPPIGHHTLGDMEKDLEEELFKLRPGEMTAVKEVPEGAVVFKCVKRLPPNKEKTLAEAQPALEKEILEKKLQLTIPKVFAELLAQAKPTKLLKGYQTQADVEKEVEQELHDAEAARKQTKPATPQGN